MSQCHSSIRPEDQDYQSFSWRNTFSEILHQMQASPVSRQSQGRCQCLGCRVCSCALWSAGSSFELSSGGSCSAAPVAQKPWAAPRDGLSTGVTAQQCSGQQTNTSIDKQPVEMKRCYHLEFMVVDMHIYWRCANNKFGCNATVENSQHEVREKSYWDVLPGFERRKEFLREKNSLRESLNLEIGLHV